MAICHDARKGRHSGGHWSKPARLRSTRPIDFGDFLRAERTRHPNSFFHSEQRKPRALHAVRKRAMLDKADLPGRSGLEAECMSLPSERVCLARRNGPIARGSPNFERVAICNKGCSWPLIVALFNTTPSGRGSLFIPNGFDTPKLASALWGGENGGWKVTTSTSSTMCPC